MKNVLIAGGSGLIGSRLTEMLLEKGYAISILSRKKSSNKNNVTSYLWNPAAGFIDDKAIYNADHIVSLAGSGIADKRWTTKRKQEIINSRVNAAQIIFKALQKNENHVKSIVCASAIGYFKKNSDELMTEASPAGNDFLAQTTQQWEDANIQFEKILRTTIFRVGIVLSLKGGALPEMYKPLKFGIAAYFGNGNQYYSWIHIDDLCSMIIYAIENENIKGIYNAIAPHPETNKNFMKTFAEIKRRFYLLLPVPEIVLKIILGERASIVLDGQNISSGKIEKTNFVFKYPDLKSALKNV